MPERVKKTWQKPEVRVLEARAAESTNSKKGADGGAPNPYS